MRVKLKTIQVFDVENFCKQNFEKTSGKFLTSDEQQDKERFQEFKTKVNKVLSLSQNLKNDIILWVESKSDFEFFLEFSPCVQ